MNRQIDTKLFYRVSHKDTQQGLWYDFKGNFTGFIHDKFNFCKNNTLKMDFDETIRGWLSATDDLDELFNWFTKEDILRLQQNDYCIHIYETSSYKFYDRFKHYIINQDNSVLIDKLTL